MTESFEERIAGAISTLYKLVGVLAAGLVLAIGLAVWGFADAQSLSSRTCQIQARGLPAGHDLAATIGDIGQLLELTPAQKKRVPAATLRLLLDLHTNAAAYFALEAKQPRSRSC